LVRETVLLTGSDESRTTSRTCVMFLDSDANWVDLTVCHTDDDSRGFFQHRAMTLY